MKTRPARVMFASLAAACAAAPLGLAQAPAASRVPTAQVQARWPRPLPNKWIVGAVSQAAVDSRNHVWIIHRPKSVRPELVDENVVAPPVIELDEQGAVVQAWGGPGAGYDWVANEHGIAVDAKGNVWVSGSAAEDSQLLKFSSAGKFLLQIGTPGQKVDNRDTTHVSRAADMKVDSTAGELYVADGEGGNRRVIVFDAETGAYKRHWGAYGETATDDRPPKYDPAAPPSKIFSNAVHCIARADDGLLYVCDRGNDRIQVFRPDGTFVKEAFVAKASLGNGSTSAIGFSADQKFLYVADGTNNTIWIVQRDTLEVVGSVGDPGSQPGQFTGIHGLTSDPKGNIYTAEVAGARLQKFAPIAGTPAR